MDNQDTGTGEPGSPTPTPPRESLRRIVERRWEPIRASLVRQWDRARTHRSFRWTAVVVVGALSVIAIAGGILIAQPRPETLDTFVKRFNEAVTTNDEATFDTLVNSAVFESNPTAYLRGVEFVRQLNADGKQVAPFEEPINPDANAIFVAAAAEYQDANHATLAFDQDDEQLTLRLERVGWARRWRINDVAATSTTNTEPATVASDGAPSNAADDAPEVMAAGLGTGGNATPLDTEFKLKQILEAWREAWENKEIDAYMAWYADYATIRRVTVVDGREIPESLTKSQLRSRMERLAQAYTHIKINISNVTVQGDYAEAGINFLQEYTANKVNGDERVLYQDVGIKNLKFVNDDGEWKIHDEDWRSYVNVPQYPIK